MKKIRIINNLPTELQDEFDLKEYIGTEWEVFAEYQPNIKRNSRNWNGLEKGEIQVILHSESDPNPKNQPSILNEGEYEYI